MRHDSDLLDRCFHVTFEQVAAALANGLVSAHGVAQPVTELDNLFGFSES